MKVTSLDKNQQETVKLRSVKEHDYIQLPNGDLVNVYQRMPGYNHGGGIDLYHVNSGNIYPHSSDKEVYELDCELIVKRKIY